MMKYELDYIVLACDINSIQIKSKIRLPCKVLGSAASYGLASFGPDGEYTESYSPGWMEAPPVESLHQLTTQHI
jgi:hypothetical protein